MRKHKIYNKMETLGWGREGGRWEGGERSKTQSQTTLFHLSAIDL